MFKSFQFRVVNVLSISLTCLSFCMLSFAPLSVSANALSLWQDESSIGRRIKQNQESKPKSFTPKTTGNSSTRAKKTQTISNVAKAKEPAQVTVYFFTKSPDTEIMLDGVSIGKTNEYSRLVVKLKTGDYTVTTKLNGAETIKPQRISVSSKTSRFDLVSSTFQPTVINVPPPPVNKTSDADKKEANDAKQQAANATETAAAQPPKLPTVAEIFERYRDPKQTAKVTAEDWQAVYYQSTTGSVPGATDTQLKAQALFSLGQMKLIEGSFADALDAFNTSANLLPTSSLAFYGLGNAYLATNQPAQAIKAYEQALKLDKEFALAYKGLGDALSRLNKPKEALEKYEKAREFGYESLSLSLYVGMNLMRQEKWANALKELETVANASPSAEIYISIGDCHREMERAMSAAEAYRKAIELNPKSAVAHYRLGELLLKEREYEQGRNYLERALVLDQEGKQIDRVQVRKLADDAAKKMR